MQSPCFQDDELKVEFGRQHRSNLDDSRHSIKARHSVVWARSGLLHRSDTELAPPVLIQAVAGAALFGAFSASALAAFSDAEDRGASAVTFLPTASGATFLGVSGAFRGLLAGGAILAIRRR